MTKVVLAFSVIAISMLSSCTKKQTEPDVTTGATTKSAVVTDSTSNSSSVKN
ncbi:MAG: hypothetical protein Q8909_12395 [Bacteroidota bacterium]|uniref:hypothetical protein n=1 Tax=Parabacteroides sp. FAFU027 TaxID=2922715 RepID=UPI001FB043D7|nr:hypothetical protein [Parabacteroides sp. FAFU027]MDP4270910.1 hypothetical protein [Bacteroidota bacterium]